MSDNTRVIIDDSYLFVEHRFPFERRKDVMKRHYFPELLELLRKTGPLNGLHLFKDNCVVLEVNI